MSSQSAFSAEEWSLLKELPFKVIFAAVVVDVRGPVGAASKEMEDAAKRLVKGATEHYPENDLIIGILRDVVAEAADDEQIALDDEEARQATIVEALALSERATALLSDLAEPHLGAEYRQWIFDAAQAATASTHSGGFLGIGAERVSDGEEAFLAQLRVALGLEQANEA
ncbi:MAG: hypothetical protein IT336_07525 [Thermomicrobiales bacterium]|nr:hypothetical protein [Thermomicrobiales bacterium]